MLDPAGGLGPGPDAVRPRWTGRDARPAGRARRGWRGRWWRAEPGGSGSAGGGGGQGGRGRGCRGCVAATPGARAGRSCSDRAGPAAARARRAPLRRRISTAEAGRLPRPAAGAWAARASASRRPWPWPPGHPARDRAEAGNRPDRLSRLERGSLRALRQGARPAAVASPSAPAGPPGSRSPTLRPTSCGVVQWSQRVRARARAPASPPAATVRQRRRERLRRAGCDPVGRGPVAAQLTGRRDRGNPDALLTFPAVAMILLLGVGLALRTKPCRWRCRRSARATPGRPAPGPVPRRGRRARAEPARVFPPPGSHHELELG